MFKKFSSGILIVILCVLLIAYVIVRYSGSNDRTFRDKILSFETSVITDITIKDPKSQDGPVELRLSGDKWVVKSGSKEYTADSNVVKSMLNVLSDMPTKRYAGKGKEAWIKYEVTDTNGTLVTLTSSGKPVAELLVGKFSYNMPKDQQQQQMQGRQPRGEMTSFVRIPDEKDVYAVDGYLKTTFSGKVDAYRFRSLASLTAGDITRMTITGPGNSKILENTSGKWIMNGMPADSAASVKYRSTIARLNGTKFIDPEMVRSSATHSLLIEGNNFTPIEIQAFPVADTNIAYAITSSANPGTFFEGKAGGLFKKIWAE
jgi:hypothetical protein